MAPYRHFADKEALLATVTHRELEGLGFLDSEAVSREPTSGGALRSALHSYTRGAGGDRAQGSGALPGGDPERRAGLLLSTLHGSLTLFLSGHLSREGKGRAAPADLVDDLLDLLGAAADELPSGWYSRPGGVAFRPQTAHRTDEKRVTMNTTWVPEAPGILRLPSGRLVRGRGLARPLPEGAEPEFALYLLGDEPPTVSWEARWVPWRDFGLPEDRSTAAQALREAWDRSATKRVEVACQGGFGRTGTALSCLAVLDGVPPGDAVSYVREHYDQNAVETPWQSRYVERFTP